MVLLAAALISPQGVFGGLVGRKIDCVRGPCGIVSAGAADFTLH